MKLTHLSWFSGLAWNNKSIHKVSIKTPVFLSLTSLDILVCLAVIEYFHLPPTSLDSRNFWVCNRFAFSAEICIDCRGGGLELQLDLSCELKDNQWLDWYQSLFLYLVNYSRLDLDLNCMTRQWLHNYSNFHYLNHCKQHHLINKMQALEPPTPLIRVCATAWQRKKCSVPNTEVRRESPKIISFG